jgi:hypothetical protein
MARAPLLSAAVVSAFARAEKNELVGELNRVVSEIEELSEDKNINSRPDN